MKRIFHVTKQSIVAIPLQRKLSQLWRENLSKAEPEEQLPSLDVSERKTILKQRANTIKVKPETPSPALRSSI